MLVGADVVGLARAQKKKDALVLSIELLTKIARNTRSAMEEEALSLAKVRGLNLSIVWT